MRIILVVALLISTVGTINVSAQSASSITGTVVDSLTRKPLALVNVVLLGADGKKVGSPGTELEFAL